MCHSLQLDGDDDAVPPAELHDVAAGGEPEELVELLTLAHHFLGARRIVPELRIFRSRIQFIQSDQGLIPVKDASSAGLWPA